MTSIFKAVYRGLFGGNGEKPPATSSTPSSPSINKQRPSTAATAVPVYASNNSPRTRVQPDSSDDDQATPDDKPGFWAAGSSPKNTPPESPRTLTDRVRAMVDSQNDIRTKQAAAPPAPTEATAPVTAAESSESKSDVIPNAPTSFPTVFHWPHGGTNVYLTGDFNGWSGKIPMHRSHNDFTLILDMPPGRYQYKFIVDNTWRYAPDQPTDADRQGVLNNVVDVEPAHLRMGLVDQDDREDSLLNLSLHGRAQAVANSIFGPGPDSPAGPVGMSGPSLSGDGLRYSQEVPPMFVGGQPPHASPSRGPVNQVPLVAGDYMKDPPALPPHLYDVPLNAFTKFADPDVVPAPQSVTLYHLFNASPLARTDEVILVGMTQRWKDKCVSTLMYQPNVKLRQKKALLKQQSQSPMAAQQ